MGMCARIVAVGPYSEAVAPFLDYPQELYRDTRTGAIVTRDLFGVSEGSSVSRELSSAVGISDPWDFNLHAINPGKVDKAALEAFAKKYAHYAEDVTSLLMLLDAGFEFHFRPEG